MWIRFNIFESDRCWTRYVCYIDDVTVVREGMNATILSNWNHAHLMKGHNLLRVFI